MATGKHHSVFDDCKADDAFSLCLICLSRARGVLFTVQVNQLEDGPVVQQLLLEEFEAERVVSLQGKCT